MTIHFPDVSHYNKGYVVPAGTPVIIARASLSSTYRDDAYLGFKHRAEEIGAVFVAYHWLSKGRELQQAEVARSTVGFSTPLMIDAEDMPGNTGYNGSNTVANILAFTAAYRSLGGKVSLVYLPRWYWRDHMGSVSLVALSAAGLHLVSSAYTTYSDTGPGWAPYGGMSPVQWQYRGSPLDLNAYRGTKEEYARMVGAAVQPVDAVTDKGAKMYMLKSTDNASVDIYDDQGNYRGHVNNEPEMNTLKAAGMPYYEVSPALYAELTTPVGESASA